MVFSKRVSDSDNVNEKIMLLTYVMPWYTNLMPIQAKCKQTNIYFF